MHDLYRLAAEVAARAERAEAGPVDAAELRRIAAALLEEVSRLRSPDPGWTVDYSRGPAVVRPAGPGDVGAFPTIEAAVRAVRAPLPRLP